MLQIYKTRNGQLETLLEPVPGCWINVAAPNEEELTYLNRELGIPEDFLTSILDVDERARTDKDAGVNLILLRIPYFQGHETDIPFITVPLGILLTNSTIITICRVENAVSSYFALSHPKSFSTAKRNRFTLQILLRTAEVYLHQLREINRTTDRLEDKLQLSMRNEELLELLKYQKSLVYFTTALKSNELMMERLRKSQLFDTYPDDQELLDDVLTENQQAIEMVGIANDILSQMMDAFASIISNNLNVVMKFLTSVTIVLMFPTLVASFYGMNVGLPLQDSPYAFLLTIVISFVLSFAVVLIFLKKDWF